MKLARNDWKKDPLENTPPVRGRGNFLKTQGYADPIRTRLKFELVNLLRTTIEDKDLEQTEIVELINTYDSRAGISELDVSRILRGNVTGYSVSHLFLILAALGNSVSIVVEPAKGRGCIAVQTRTIA